MALALRLAADLGDELRVLHGPPAAGADVVHVRPRALVGRNLEFRAAAVGTLGDHLADPELHDPSVIKARSR